MTEKLNLFTLMIFVYSIVVCATFKKDLGHQESSTAKVIELKSKSESEISVVRNFVKKFPNITNFNAPTIKVNN